MSSPASNGHLATPADTLSPSVSGTPSSATVDATSPGPPSSGLSSGSPSTTPVSSSAPGTLTDTTTTPGTTTGTSDTTSGIISSTPSDTSSGPVDSSGTGTPSIDNDPLSFTPGSSTFTTQPASTSKAPRPTTSIGTVSSTIQSPTSTLPSSSTASTPTASTPTSTATAPASSTTAHPTSVFTSTNTHGSVVIVTSTLMPAPTTVPGVNGTAPPAPEETGPNIGAIIGGIAGGLVGIILLTWLILIPIRRRAALKKEVDWMAFGSENDHSNNESGNNSIFRSPRGGVGEVEQKGVETPEMFQMGDIASGQQAGGGDMTGMYSHLDKTAGTPANWVGAGVGAGGYGAVGGQVVGEVPGYDPNYAVYYHQQAMAQQQQQQQAAAGYAPQGPYSDHGSPEMGAQRYAGQQAPPWPPGHPSSQQSHLGPSQSVHSLGSHSAQKPLSRSQSDAATVVEGKFGHAPLPPLPIPTSNVQPALPSKSSLPPPRPGLGGPKMSSHSELSDSCGLAYDAESIRDSPTPDVGAMHGLRLANPDR